MVGQGLSGLVCIMMLLLCVALLMLCLGCGVGVLYGASCKHEIDAVLLFNAARTSSSQS